MLASSLILSLVPVPALVAQETDDSAALLIRAERVVVAPGKELQNTSLLIENGVIVAIGEGLVAPEGAREIEGKVVCAGFVDAWSTLGVDGQSASDLSTSPSTETADAVDPWRAPELSGEALRGGVTSARVQAGMRAFLGGVGTMVRHASGASDTGDLILVADACMAASIGITRSGRSLDVFDRVGEVGRLIGQLDRGRRYREDELEYRDELAEWEKAIEKKKKELEKDFKKAKKDRDKKKKEAEEKGRDFKEERYKEDKKPKRPKYDADAEALARVANGELPLVVEVHGAQEIRNLLDKTAGYDRVRLVLAGATEAGAYADVLSERGIPVILWPTPMGASRQNEYEEHELSLAGELARAGVSVSIGSGGGLHARELRLLAALAVGHGMDPDAALAAITNTPAGLFDVGDRIGTVERGKDADLLILDGDPLDTTARIQFVISNGRVVVE